MTGIWVSHWAGRYLEAVLWSKFVAKKSVKYLEVSLKVYTFAPVKQKGHGRVAQLNRVADYGSAGYRFESCRGHEKRMCQNDASSFRYIIIVLPFFIEYDLCFSYVHAFWGYNVL